MFLLVIFVVVLTVFVTWTLHRDLQRSVARRAYRLLVVKIVPNLKQFQNALKEMSISTQEASDAIRRFGETMRQRG